MFSKTQEFIRHKSRSAKSATTRRAALLRPRFKFHDLRELPKNEATNLLERNGCCFGNSRVAL